MSRTEPATRRVLREAMPPFRRLLPSVLAGIASGASAVALLAASAWLITRAAEQPPILFLSLGIVGVRAFALSRAVFRYLERLAGHDAAFRQLAAVRAGVYERMLPVAPDGVPATRGGELLARFVGDVDELQNLALRVVQPVVSALVVLLAAVAGIAFLAPGAAAGLSLVLVAGIGLALLAQHRAGARADRELAPLRGRLQQAVVEHLRTRELLVAYGAAEADLDRIDGVAAELGRVSRARAVASGAVAASVAAMGGVGAAVALGLAAPLLSGGSIDGPTLAVLALVPLAIAEVAAAVPPAAAAWRVARSAAQRVADAVPAEVPPELPVPSTSPRALPDGGAPRLELRGVSADWPGAAGSGRPAALRPVDLDVAPGERVLVRGPSGSGKTTLAHVLVRFLEYGGSYRLDGVEARELDAHRLRDRIGLVEQRPWLFDESIRQNLIFARDTASDAELEAVVERVGLGEWMRERGGLDAPVGERGALVSGGQAHRIALARAMLADFDVLVLDEPTASVDRARAEALLAELLGAASGRSVVLISHTPVAPGLVDRELVLGCAVGGGTALGRASRALG
ncbi:thiol reductant ABC exporter subunit CydC [Agromyces mediolanus]|uniref:thiol reductant ABC exporter subunit CydC n=1 Tax=Agromyces mediolanus TaxID=41986 RepID=UPI003832ED25